MKKKSKYEEQLEKIKKVKRNAWKKVFIYLGIIYTIAAVVSWIFNLSGLYAARTMLFGLALILMSFYAGAKMQSEIQKHLIPAPADRESPELVERINED